MLSIGFKALNWGYNQLDIVAHLVAEDLALRHLRQCLG